MLPVVFGAESVGIFEHFGKCQRVALKVAFLSGVSSTCSDVTLVGDGVAYIRDGASGGGSVKNWRSIVEEGSIAILSNMNKHIYEKAEADSDIQVEVVETSASGNDR